MSIIDVILANIKIEFIIGKEILCEYECILYKSEFSNISGRFSLKYTSFLRDLVVSDHF